MELIVGLSNMGSDMGKASSISIQYIHIYIYIYTYNSKGERYNGEYNMGRKHGHGRMVWPDGSIYDGHFDKDKCCGHGLLTW